MDELTAEIKRCKAKLTRLENRGEKDSDGYRYWYERLLECEEARFNQELTALEQQYGPITLEKTVMTSNAVHVVAYTAAGRYVKNIRQDLIPATVKDLIPVTRDFSPDNPPCEVCGAKGTELHHWAPCHLFANAENWPKSYLCKKHHNEWHNIILNHWRNGNGHKPNA